MRFLIFFSVIISVLALGALYIGYFATRSGWFEEHRRVLWLTLALFILLQVLGPVLYRTFPDHAGRFFVLHWLTYISLGVFACLLFYTFAADVIQLVLSHLTGPAVDPERRNFLIVSALTFGTVSAGVAQAMAGPKVYEVDIPLDNLPQEFDGFKIVQISDLHVGPLIGRGYVENVAKIASGLAPDMVALTGDFSDGKVEQLGDAMRPITEIPSKHGSFFITGNHEYYWDTEEWLAYFKKSGTRVLLNEHVVLKQGAAAIVVGGVTDRSAAAILPEHASDAKKAFAGAPGGLIKILLAHQPSSYLGAEEAGADLQLSGHTHGGQFFPWSMVVKMVQSYYKGLNRYKNMWIYVNRGTGYWGPPVRFTVPSEITLLRLVRVRKEKT